MLRIVLALVELMVLAPMAEAASFDCSKAASAVEKAVCADPGLSEQDEILAQAYATALGGLSKPAADEIKTAQHAWLDYAARVCTAFATPITGSYDADGIACLDSTYRGRIKDLEASRMQSGYRFYPIDRYLVEADPDAGSDSYNKVADKQYATIKMDRTGELADAFNAMIDAYPATNTDLFAGDGSLKTGNTSEDYDVATEVEKVTTHLITLKTTGSWYGHGGAHPNYWITTTNFLIEEKRPLEASDVFAGDDWQAKLGKMILDKLQAQIEGGIWDEAVPDVTQWAGETDRWSFSDDGLIVQFQPYEVTAYAAGAPTVTIPWDELTPLLAEGAQELVVY